MATMMKEKPRPKKKTKEKRATNTEMPNVEPYIANLPIIEELPSAQSITDQDKLEDNNLPSTSLIKEETASTVTESTQNETLTESSQSSSLQSLVPETTKINSQTVSTERNEIPAQNVASDQTQSAYKDLCHRLDIMSYKDVPVSSDTPIEELESNLEASASAYINQATEQTQSVKETIENTIPAVAQNMTPSAPMFEESLVSETPESQATISEIRLEKLQCMPLEVAMHICGGREMAEVREMSEREEAIVGGMSMRPEHPLVDLLSTYRCSVIAFEQESEKIIKRISDEKKSRAALWRVEKKTVCKTEKCNICKRSVSYTGQYEHATLLKEKLPAAQLRLEGLLKDYEESYCMYQHQALLAYYQIEEFISETVRSSIGDIREALALVLQELRASGSITSQNMEHFTDTLKRWAKVLCGALLARSDARQLLFLLHQLFRQSHSVRWAAPLIRVPMCDTSDAARTLAVLDLMLAAPVLETAKECTEAESEELWEEVDRHGSSGAVSEGALRERDLLALFKAFPLQGLVARLVLLQRSDITQTRPYEWQHAARDVLRACCGVRALLATLARAAHAHPSYTRLREELRALAAHAQHAVAELHRHNRDAYPKDIGVQIEAELEAIFRAGWGLLEPTTETAALEAPPASLLRPAARAAYCVALMTNLHEKQPLVIDGLSLSLSLSCGQRARALAQAACREDSAETLSMLADFLVQVALKRNKHCNGACVDAARECLPNLLSEQDYLYTGVVHSIAYVHQLEPLAPSAAILKPFCLQRWRPSTGEIRAVLDDWWQRGAVLLPYLLQELSYTPYDGLSLESQLVVGSWLCGLPAPAPDWAWSVLVKLRVHRSSWRLPIDAPPPEHTQGVFAEAYAVLSSSWGHSLPLICEYGVDALSRVAAARAPVAAHALPLVMAAMMHSPESVGLTPQFASLTSALLAPAQSLAQWARGEKPAAPDILLRRMLAHVENQPSPADRDAAVSAWLQALCRAGLAGAPLAACDALLLATRHTYTHQEAPKPEVVSHLVRNAVHAPLACAAALLAAHAHCELSVLFPRLLNALAQQRANGQKIHVDNALKQIGAAISSEELVVHQTAAALLAPAGRPALPLWALLMHLYLHSANISSDPAPIGPLFFSGLVKSRTLTQLKKRLHETILHHHNQAATFKTLLNTRPEPIPEAKSKSSTPETLLPKTSLGGLTESSGSETDSGDETDDVSGGEERRRVNCNMLAYHEAAEKMLREYSCWLEAGDRLRATPHHAAIARYIPDAALSTAWAEQLNAIRPTPSSEDDDVRAPRTPPASEPPLTPLQRAVRRILRIKDRGEGRSRVPTITSPVGDVDFGSPRQLYALVDKHLASVETFARQWSTDVNRVAVLDSKLWPLVGSLRYRKGLTAVRKQCPNQCGPVLLDLQGHAEWPISENAARGIKENRASAGAALSKLLRVRPDDAKTVAALNTIARRINSPELAVSVAARAWGCARAAPDCCAARAALAGLLELLADRWISSNNNALTALVPTWCARAATPAQQALCRSLLARGGNDPRLYTALLRALCEREPCEPQRAFSYLSKFDVSRCADEAARADMLEALSSAAQRWGREPPPDLNVLLELIGVHTVALTTGEQLPTLVLSVARAAAAGRVPPAHVAHVARAAAVAKDVPFDKLGHLLRELGMLWWRARAELQTSGATHHAAYAEHVAALQHALQRAFVAQAVALSYAPERVSVYAWSALQESWSAWVAPHAAPPLLPAGDAYSAILRRLVDNVHQCMLDCPGSEEYLLSQVWEWTIQIYLNVTSIPAATARDSRVQLSELLAQLGKLPWCEHQWPRATCLPAALQIITTTDLELQTWLGDTLRGVQAATWLRGVRDCELAPHLAALLALFAGPPRLRTETLEQAVHLPWQRLPEPALDQALERFFVEHHNPQHPYHDAPQFRVILAASGLEPACARGRGRRARAVSQWTRAASAPALVAHVAQQAAELLQVIAALGMYPLILAASGLEPACARGRGRRARAVSQWTRAASAPALVAHVAQQAAELLQVIAALGMYPLILAASGLEPACARGRGRRARAVSQWTRAASAPALVAHVAQQAAELLQVIAALGMYPLILAASGLEPACARGRGRRARAVSQWTRAASAPALVAHVAQQAAELLQVIAALGMYPLILAASGLEPACARGRGRRARAVSQWTRAASAPALVAHVAQQAAELLQVIAALGMYPLILAASGLEPACARGRGRRARAVSQWTRAASAPALVAHVAQQAAELLQVIAALGMYPLILAASGLEPACARGRGRRARAVSQWTRAASAPALVAHVAQQAAELLQVIAALGMYPLILAASGLEPACARGRGQRARAVSQWTRAASAPALVAHVAQQAAELLQVIAALGMYPLILAASGLEPACARGRGQRARAVSQWTRAASAPALVAHVAQQAAELLQVIAALGMYPLILAASGLEPACARGRGRRARAVSQWTRAASAPALVAHVAQQAAELLQVIAALEPHVEEGSDELEELLSRAVVIMCMEPAAAEALPVWVKWISGATPRVTRACVSAARALTTLEYFASVADAAASAFMNVGGTWAELAARLHGCAWAEPGPLLRRGRLHAAYALALTAPAQPADIAAIASFASKELIVSVWICALSRCALDAGAEGPARAAARAQLARWAEPPRSALMRVLSSTDEPTNKHRLLCRLALCLLTPNSEPLMTNLVRAHEACPSPVSQADLLSWARTPSAKHLPALAAPLFPGSEKYFAEEMRLAGAVTYP